MKYTEIETKILTDLYGQGVAIHEIATTLNRSERSVIAKLCQMGLYEQKEAKPAKRRKSEVIESICELLEYNFTNLDKLTLSELLTIEKAAQT